MAFGDLLIQLRVPAKPGGTTETHAEYMEAVRTAAAAHLTSSGFEPARFAWLSRSDVPEDPADAASFAATRVGDTSINPSAYAFALESAASFLCVVNGEVKTYTAVLVSPGPSDPTPNAFEFDVTLSGPTTVTVQMVLVVRTMQPFSSGA
ncbi:MAG: hypothetical protein R3B68_15680 [Phycisphaerales bacterium]